MFNYQFYLVFMSQIQKKIEQLAAYGLDTASLDDEAFDMEASRDRCILRLIANCCNGIQLHLDIVNSDLLSRK